MRSLLSLPAFNCLIVPSLSLSIVLVGFLLVCPIIPASPAAGVGQKVDIPVGTVLPVSLEHPLSSKDLTKGESIEGRIMQDVPLPNREKIPIGAKIHGTILSAVSAEKGPASITFRLDSIELRHVTVAVVTGLRVMAPFEDVQAAHAPYQQVTSGSPSDWATTVQIGGDRRYGSGGKVTNRHNQTIGKATSGDGVLVHLQDPPDSPCAGWPSGPEHPQALWVFSAHACGLFDLRGMRIAHAGNTDPLGEITLTKEEGDIKIMKSSALLLRTVR
ncbi:MAG TPA: hypothetical protein VJX70_08810 [Candidatus Acidoferrum sp.]|nr:hypothetical protein [Candidatus Acidoferrum sp.]